jgi:hypothetical protein
VLKVNNQAYLDTIFHIKNKTEVDSGTSAYCGADVVASYKIFNDRQVFVDEAKALLHLGDFELPALENVIIGMKEQETRTAMIFYPYAGSLKDYMLSDEEKMKGLKMQVTLSKVLSKTIEGVRIFDNMASFDKTIICGENTSSKVRITDFQGKVISQQDLNYKVGDRNYPAIFSYALFNKSAGSTRSVVSPAKYLKSNSNEDAKDRRNHENLVLIEFYN